MTESVLKSILEEYAEREWARYADVPEHVFSQKHNRSMKRVFRLYEKNTRKFRTYSASRPMPKIKFTRKNIMLIMLIVFLAVLTGCAATYFMSQSFRGEVYSDNTELFPINLENCPTIIEEKYFLPEIPDGFEVYDTKSTPFSTYISFINKQTGQTISFSQHVKEGFDSIHFNTEKGELVEVEINGHYGLFLDVSDEENISSGVIWDNGDYILEVTGNLTKYEVINLAKSAEIYQKT